VAGGAGPRPEMGRIVRLWRALHRHLLPPVLRCAASPPRAGRLLPAACRGRGGGVPRLPPLSPAAGQRRCAGGVDRARLPRRDVAAGFGVIRDNTRSAASSSATWSASFCRSASTRANRSVRRCRSAAMSSNTAIVASPYRSQVRLMGMRRADISHRVAARQTRLSRRPEFTLQASRLLLAVLARTSAWLCVMSVTGNPLRTANSRALGAQRKGRNLVETGHCPADDTGREAPLRPFVGLR